MVLRGQRMMYIKPAVVLLSGGIDSTTTLAFAKNEGFQIYAISFDYGQRHRVELNGAKECAAFFNIQKHLIIKFDLREIGGSALTSDIEVPKRVTSYELRVTSKNQKQPTTCNLQPATFIPLTYVPARNTIFLSFALAWAESIGAEDIFIGANVIDYSGYPDCRPEFISAFENMANLATKASIEKKARFKIHTPLINLTKGEIIKKGIELGVDFSMTWSCYDPQIHKLETRNSKLETMYVPCNRCDSCLLRAKGFREAGIEDPLISKIKSKGS
jgi:7-cyano-7-deazaguanine synthase